MENKTRILVVDDEESLCEILQFNLEMAGYYVDVAYSAEQVLALDLSQYSLLLLDVMMGEISGFTLAKEIRGGQKNPHIPIIFCTAKDTEEDTLRGFEIGADDYISKPFSVKEVVARVRSILRRAGATQEEERTNCSNRLVYKTLVVDTDKIGCSIDGKEISLTKKEIQMLILFLSNLDKILSREEILSAVWSESSYVFDRTIDVNVTRLRKKLGRYGKNIITRQGYGYGFES